MLRSRDRSRGGSGGNSGPTLSLNFLSSTAPANTVFTRATVATDVINGVLTDFASGAPRVSAANGYLSEISRTNSIRNGECGGSVTGTPGTLPTNWTDVNTVGLTREIVGQGTVSGFSYVDIRISGTPSAGTYSLLTEDTAQIVASSGQRWSASLYAAIISGSLTGITSTSVRVSGRNAGAETEGTSQSISLTVDPTRVSAIRTLNNASTTRVIAQFDVVVTAVAIDATFRISSVQCELGYGSTSYIRTTSTAVTRNADVMYITTANIPSYNSVGTLIMVGKTAPFFGPDAQTYAYFTNNPVASDEHRFFKDPSNFNYTHYQGLVNYGGTAFAETNKPPDLGIGQPFNIGASWALGASNVRVNVNGQTPTTLTLSSLPSCNRLYIGATSAGAGQFCGYMQRIDYYPINRTDV